MKIKDFKVVKNRQRPEQCYAFEKKEPGRKYSIFTMDSGETFLASIDEPRGDGRWYTQFSETHNSVDSSLLAFDKYLLANPF